jgi:eukaryotic-like serine/threonine-protein kinase
MDDSAPVAQKGAGARITGVSMTPERWQQIKVVLHGALELKPQQRSGFLAKACADDPTLRQEVESLLAVDDQERFTPMIGKTIAHYRVLGELGSGGMGVVYKAEDLKLQRHVALKFLPEGLAGDSTALQRFQREARAASALNHPNICTIYEVEEHETQPVIVMELLEGESLKDKIRQGPLPMNELLEFGIQSSEALEAAHAKRIIHRDIKPGNIFIVDGRRVKILDFGLAKVIPGHLAENELGDETLTMQGFTPGTTAYMSPEQIRGEDIDTRSDLFSLGVVLYEMATAKKPFVGKNRVLLMNAILNSQPVVPSRVNNELPASFDTIISKALEKNPARRYQQASELRSDLQQLKWKSESASPRFQSASDPALALGALSAGVQPPTALTQPDRPLRKREWLYAPITAAVVVAAALALFQFRTRNSLVPTTEWVQVTNFTDSVTQPAFSPDGRMLTFLRGNDTFATAGQVYVMLLPNGNPVRLTNDSWAKMSPIFSPDGSSIAYTVPWDTWTVPVLGGQPQLWLPNVSGLSWVDTDHLMFSEITSGAHMQLVRSDLSRARVQPIYTPGSFGMVHRSYLSPDGKWVIAVEMTGNLWEPCRLVPFDGTSHGKVIGPADGACTAAAWSPDGKSMYLNSNSGHAFHIWRQQFPNGRIEQITSGPTEEEGIAMAPDGKSLVTGVGINRSAVWLHDSQGERMLTSEATAALADPRNGGPFSRDGKKLYYLIRRSRGREIWSAQSVGELWELDLWSGTSQAVLPGFSISDFSFSPNGRDIAFSALDERGTFNIWVADLDRSSSPRLLQSSAERVRFTSDFIYYIKRAPAGSYAYRIHPDGSSNEQIWNEKILTIGFSSDGRYLAATLPLNDKHSEWKLVIVDWARKRVQPICNDAIAYWSDDGRSFFVTGSYGKMNKNAPIYVIRLRESGGIPQFPSQGFSDISQIAGLTAARAISLGMIAPGPSPDTYAYVKETVQRNLYRIPLR